MKQKKAVFFDSQLKHETVGYAITKDTDLPKGLCLSEKELHRFANRSERLLINSLFLMTWGVKDLAMYYVAKKFELDVENIEFDGHWYKVPVPADNVAVPAAMLFEDKTGKKFISYAIIRDER